MRYVECSNLRRIRGYGTLITGMDNLTSIVYNQLYHFAFILQSSLKESSHDL